MSRERRARYEASVAGLRQEADRRLAAGETEEAVGRALVAMRNGLKQSFRAEDDPALVADMEARNLLKYGDPVGPDADWFLARYGSWRLVIAAACRPSLLSRAPRRPISGR